MKASSLFLTFLGLLLVIISPRNTFAQSITPTVAPAYVTIINQIRGESCCAPGSITHTRAQLDLAVSHGLPMTFVLRYDALIDPRYTDLIRSYQRAHPDLIKTGVMVEIIPTLVESTNDQFSNSNTRCVNVKEKVGRDVSTFDDMTKGERPGLEGQGSPCSESESDCPSETYERCAQTECGARSSEREDNANDLPCQIKYIGSSETWFQAQNAYTIGYPVDSRRAIIDILLAQYHTVFDTYPEVSSAWMIDTDSVNYLHDRYGVQVHQITREQWGTDSYTLYGGPPHYPYPASRAWVMIPDYTQRDPIMMVRQTVADPLYNYGDTSSSHTTQPNDYMRAGKSIDYFTLLLDNTFSQSGQPGFANLGLENSMSEEYHMEFARQMAIVASRVSEGKLDVVSPQEAVAHFRTTQTTTYSRQDGDREAVWYTTPHYRARIMMQGGRALLTDLRIYDVRLDDPYNTRVARHDGYWVVPFLIDGSRFYDYRGVTGYPHRFIPIVNDYSTHATGYILADDPGNVSMTREGSELVVRDTDDRIIARLSGTSLTLASDVSYHGYSASRFPIRYSATDRTLTWMRGDRAGWGVRGGTCDAFCTLTPYIDPASYRTARDSLYPYLYPEPVGHAMSDRYTKIKVHNTYAIAGRNPVRILLEPHDELNFPIILDSEANIQVMPADTSVTPLGSLVSSQAQYIDLDSHDPREVRIVVTLQQFDKTYTVKRSAYFAPECRQDIAYCLTHPIHGLWYVATHVSDAIAGRR